MYAVGDGYASFLVAWPREFRELSIRGGYYKSVTLFDYIDIIILLRLSLDQLLTVLCILGKSTTR